MSTQIASVLLLLLLRYSVEVSTKPACESGQFLVNGVCVQQWRFCPIKSIYLNGICFPTAKANCTEGHVFVAETCCTESCIRKCEHTDSCDCCGNLKQMTPKLAANCAYTIIPPCGHPILPCESKTTTTSRPVKCPEGTRLVLGNCRLIHCSNGVYKNGMCVRYQCPRNTFWNGRQCEKESVNYYQISFNNTYTTSLTSNQVKSNTLYDWNEIEKDDLQHIDEISEDNTATVSSNVSEKPATWEEILEDDKQNNTNCCSIISPRICQLDQAVNEWQCFNRRHEYCGDFCTTKTICLLPARSRQCPNFMVVAPPPKNITVVDEDSTRIDCSGCVCNNYTKCSKYCYFYAPCSDLNPIDCQSFQQHEFCANNAGIVGCLQADGYYDSLPNL